MSSKQGYKPTIERATSLGNAIRLFTSGLAPPVDGRRHLWRDEDIEFALENWESVDLSQANHLDVRDYDSTKFQQLILPVSEAEGAKDSAVEHGGADQSDNTVYIASPKQPSRRQLQIEDTLSSSPGTCSLLGDDTDFCRDTAPSGKRKIARTAKMPGTTKVITKPPRSTTPPGGWKLPRSATPVKESKPPPSITPPGGWKLPRSATPTRGPKPPPSITPPGGWKLPRTQQSSTSVELSSECASSAVIEEQARYSSNVPPSVMADASSSRKLKRKRKREASAL